MRQQTRHCTVALPREVLWDYLADYSNVLRLATNRDGALRKGNVGEVGVTYRADVEWEGLVSRFDTRLVHAERPGALTWRALADAGSQLDLQLDPVDPRTTTVRVTCALALRPAVRPLEPFAWGLMMPLLDRFMRKLHELHPESLEKR
jgi:hypothetical protein